MIGMVHLLPPRALHLFERRSGVVVPSLVVPVTIALRVGGPGKLAHVVGELVKSDLAGGKRRFRALTFGNFLSYDVDAENAAAGNLEGMPVGNPHTLCVAAVRPLSFDLYTGDRLSRPQNRLHDI